MNLRSTQWRGLVIRALALAVALGWPQSAAAAQGVRYTLLPSASYVRWDTDLDLERALMFGGRALADFGPLVGLEAHYLVGGGIVARLSESGLTDSLGAPLENSTLDVTDYGIGLRVNIGSAGLDPFLRAGGRVLRFDEGARSGPRQIALSYGGGIRINASPRLRAELFVEETRFRLDRSRLAAAATPGTDPQREALRRNLTLGGGVGFVIGGGPSRQGPPERWSVASVPLEAFAGRIDFDDPALGRHSLAGVRAGIDAGNYVGLRAYYMRGLADGFRSFEALRSIGGEARFNLNAAPRLAPYLVLGGGTVGFAPDYRDAEGEAPADRTTLILGGGIGLRLNDKFRLDLAFRDFINGRTSELGDVTTASELQHNPMYSAGVSVSIGRSRRGIALVEQNTTRAPGDSARAAVPPPSGADTIARLLSALPAEPRGLVVDSAARRDTSLSEAARSATGYHSPTTVVLPVPTEGELYVRYGPPAARDAPASRGTLPVGAPARADSSPPPLQIPAGAPPTGSPAASPPSGAATPDTAFIAAAIRRVFDERRRVDSLLIRDLVSREVSRWRSEVDRMGHVATSDPAATSRETRVGPPAAPADTVLLAALRAERDSARVERRRLQLRFDSLEAEVRRNTARSAADDSASAAERSRRLASDSAARAEARAAAEAESADSARRAAGLERRRADALSVVESSIPSVTEVRESERGLVIVLGNDLFAPGQSSLGERARIELRAVASLFALYPDGVMVIEGHTDSTGSAEVNQRLSEARAHAVRGGLIAHGIPSDRITARGYGETQPIAGNTTADERARNRRAEIIIVGARRPRPASG